MGELLMDYFNVSSVFMVIIYIFIFLMAMFTTITTLPKLIEAIIEELK